MTAARERGRGDWVESMTNYDAPKLRAPTHDGPEEDAEDPGEVDEFAGLRSLADQVLRWDARDRHGMAHPETSDLARGTLALLAEVDALRGEVEGLRRENHGRRYDPNLVALVGGMRKAVAGLDDHGRAHMAFECRRVVGKCFCGMHLAEQTEASR